MPRTSKLARARTAVLYLDSDRAEWYDVDSDGAARYGESEVAGESAGDLADAALRALEASGSKRRTCVLALGPGLVSQRLLSLPTLKASDARAVMLRKAAADLGCEPDDTLYSALRFSNDRTDSELNPWLLLSLRRKLAISLRKALRRRHIKVKRVVPARLGGVARAHEAGGASDGTSIVVNVEADAISVTLVSGEALLTQNILSGDLVTNPQMAVTLIQEVKSYEAYWRKESRGQEIDRVAIVGLGVERGALLRNALRNALPAVDVELCSIAEEHEASGRCSFLDACLAGGPFSFDLKAPLPTSPLASALIVLMMATMALGAAVVAKDRIAEETRCLQEQAELLSHGTEDLEEIEMSVTEAKRRISEMEQAVDSLTSLEEVGLPLEVVLGSAFDAFRGRGRILTFSARRDGKVELGAVADSDPLRALQAIEAISSDLSSSLFDDVHCEPASRLPGVAGGDSENDYLEFEVEARLRGGE